MPILELDRVSKSFATGFIPRRRAILHDLSFAVEAGEAFGFLGPNGAGKTTTIKLLVGLLFPDRGVIRLGGRRASDHEARRALGFLPENPYFYDYLTGGEFLDFYGRLCGLDPAARRARSERLLERLSLGRARDLPLRRYSKGMVQRIGFAQALLGEPQLLVLDEPMSGLDPIGRRDFRDLILEQRARGTTVFFSSHILQDAELICDRVAILVSGRLATVAGLDQLLRAGDGGFEVRIDGIDLDPPQPGARVLARNGVERLVRVDGREAAEAVMAWARQSGGRVTQLTPARATLEDLFLREVGRGAPPPAAEGARR